MDGYALRDQTIGPDLLGGATIERTGHSGSGPSAPLFSKTASLQGGRLAGAVAASLALHACLLLGFVQYAHQGRHGEDVDVEAPIELVLESPAASRADMQASPAPAQAPNALPAVPLAMSEPVAEPQPPLAAEVRPAPPLEDSVTRPASAPAPEPAAALQRRMRALEAERAAKERERRRALELAREQAEERAEQRAAERARQQAAAQRATERARATAERRAAERAEAGREARAALQVSREGGSAAGRQAPQGASAPSARASRAAEADAFDAASYRSIVARAVRAAVGSRCSIGAGSRVVIALVIGSSGAISSASITSPSGIAAFDSASIAAVRRAGPFPPPSGRSSVSVPVGVACR